MGVAVDAFVAAVGAPAKLTPPARARLQEALASALARGREAHEGLSVDETRTAGLLGEVVAARLSAEASQAEASRDADEAAGEVDTAAQASGAADERPAVEPALDRILGALSEVPVGDVVLALSCTDGREAAMQRFRARHMPAIASVARRTGHVALDPEELAAHVIEKLFVPRPDARPRILDLVGRGELAGLVRVIAVRTAINLSRRERREITDPNDALATAIASQTDPELAAIKQDHRGAIKGALEAAIAELAPDERNLLRLSLLHRLTIDEIATLQQVHRSTAARRLAKIREQLGAQARRRLRIELGAAAEDLEHVFRLVRSSLHVSFERLLE